MSNIYSGETTTITIRVPVELKEKLTALGKQTRRSNSFLAAEALSGYVESEEDIIRSIEKGLEDIKAGRGIPHEDVMNEMRKMIDASKP